MVYTASSESEWIFGQLCAYVASTDLEIPVTVITGGYFISGNLISGHRFLEKFKEHIEPTSKDKSEEVKERWECLKILIEATAKNTMDVAVAGPCPHYFHLANATVHKGNPRKAANPKEILFRGKVDEIAGFYLDFA